MTFDGLAGRPGRPERGEEHRGLVLGTPGEAATPLEFWVYVDPERFLQLDDVVHVQTALPDGDTIDIYGVVDQVEARQEGVSLTSDVALAVEGTLPAAPVVAAHVSVTRVEPEVLVPPLPGCAVVLASGEARARALSFDRMDPNDLLPLGRSRTGHPVYGNLQFLDGGSGAHLNISGISGVATKTSYATYLLYALFEGGVLRERAANARAVIFNVKGEDLLFLDQPNAKLTDEDRAAYASLGLPAGPFGSVSFYAPTRPGEVPMPDTGSRQAGITACYWTLHEFCEKRYLRYLFAEPESDNSQLFDVVEGVAARLARAAGETPFERADGDVEIEGERVSSFGALVDLIESRLEPDDDGNAGAWSGGFGGAAQGTLRAFLRRLRGAQRHVAPLIRGAGFGPADEHRIALERQITVIDLHRLPDRAQRFVVGVVLAELMERGERRGVAGRQAPTFVMVDELNKYAPREGRSPIKELLLDIAERGRSLGVILIGAQQTASEVEQRIVANASFRVVGRLDTAEATRGEYRYLGAARDRATLLTPGTMIVQQPEIPVPLLVQFPHPSWATRASEVAPDATPASPAPASLAAASDAHGVESADILDRFED
jgi:hypothetical protein